jgi:ATP-dependent DNA ligase
VHLERFYEVLKQKGEGLVIKDLNAPYGRGWKKWKRTETYDMIVTGFTEGNNKFRGMFGAVEFGAFDQEGELVYMGQCSGLEDGNCDYKDEAGNVVAPNSEGCILVPVSKVQPVGSRAWFHLNRDDLIGSAIEVKCSGLTAHGKLRHPQFFRMRPDKSASECLVPKTGDK